MDVIGQHWMICHCLERVALSLDQRNLMRWIFHKRTKTTSRQHVHFQRESANGYIASVGYFSGVLLLPSQSSPVLAAPLWCCGEAEDAMPACASFGRTRNATRAVRQRRELARLPWQVSPSHRSLIYSLLGFVYISPSGHGSLHFD